MNEYKATLRFKSGMYMTFNFKREGSLQDVANRMYEEMVYGYIAIKTVHNQNVRFSSNDVANVILEQVTREGMQSAESLKRAQAYLEEQRKHCKHNWKDLEGSTDKVCSICGLRVMQLTLTFDPAKPKQVDFVNVSSKDIRLDSITPKEFSYLKQQASFGEAIGKAFAAGMELKDGKRIITNEIDLLYLNYESE